MPFDTLTDDTLRAFLEAFYAEIRRDPLLAPVFATKIADDDWPAHLAIIHDFWSSILLKSGRYKGNPFAKHQTIAGIAPPHFERWLGLFAETAKVMFAPELAQELDERANRIADSLKAGLFFHPARHAVS